MHCGEASPRHLSLTDCTAPSMLSCSLATFVSLEKLEIHLKFSHEAGKEGCACFPENLTVEVIFFFFFCCEIYREGNALFQEISFDCSICRHLSRSSYPSADRQVMTKKGPRLHTSCLSDGLSDRSKRKEVNATVRT